MLAGRTAPPQGGGGGRQQGDVRVEGQLAKAPLARMRPGIALGNAGIALGIMRVATGIVSHARIVV